VSCTLTEPRPSGSGFDLRLGFRDVRGLRRQTAAAIVQSQPFRDIDDLARRVPELNQDEMRQLAAIGALNSIGAAHRRDALWQASHAVRPARALLREIPEHAPASPLRRMNLEERLVADCHGTGMSVGRHPMAYRREELNRLGVIPAAHLPSVPNGHPVRVAGNVIVRQRPGTAKGILFLSLEDETGIANVVIMPDVFDRQRAAILSYAWVMVEGEMQNVDRVVHVRARHVAPLTSPLAIGTASHDFR
jgi:error-prone DNA polymerase